MNCRQGDLAVIVRSRFEENIGALVDVVAPSTEPDRDWFIRSAGRQLTGVGDDGEVGVSTEGHIMDSDLRPLRGEPQPAVDEIRELTPQQLECVACWPT